MIDEKKLIEKLFNLRWDFIRDDLQLQWNRAIDKVVHVIQEQPTIQPQTGWIPCSERLPKPYEEVIFCNNIISCYGSIDSDGVWWASDVIPFKQFMKAYNVIAWQPLPQPYKEGGE